MVEEPSNVRRQVLPNGLIVLTEEMPHIRSVSIGIWVRTGSRHEEAEANGGQVCGFTGGILCESAI